MRDNRVHRGPPMSTHPNRSEIQYQGKPLRDWLKSLGGGEATSDSDAVKALRHLGPAAVPDLIKALEDEDWEVRNQAAVALGVIGPEAKAAVPALIDVLQGEDKYLRSHAATALGKVGRQAGTAVPALTRALQDKDEDVRRNAAAALGQIGPDSKGAVSDLIELLKDERKPVRQQALKALEQLDPEEAARHRSFWSQVRDWFG